MIWFDPGLKLRERRGKPTPALGPRLYLCLEYLDAGAWRELSAEDRASFRSDWGDCQQALQESGRLVVGLSLEEEVPAAVLSCRSGCVAVEESSLNDEPRRLLSISILSARDLNQAIQLVSRRPVLKQGGVVELRRAICDELNVVHLFEANRTVLVASSDPGAVSRRS